MTTIKGVAVFGPAVTGEIIVMSPSRGVIPSDLDFSFAGKILVVPGWISIEVLQKAGLVGIACVVVSQIHYRDFEQAKNQGEFSLLLLDKFGKLEPEETPPDLIRKLEKFSGKSGSFDPEEKTLKVS